MRRRLKGIWLLGILLAGTSLCSLDPGSVYKGFAAALAESGFVTIAVDVGQHEVYEQGRTLMGERLWDLMCQNGIQEGPKEFLYITVNSFFLTLSSILKKMLHCHGERP